MCKADRDRGGRHRLIHGWGEASFGSYVMPCVCVCLCVSQCTWWSVCLQHSSSFKRPNLQILNGEVLFGGQRWVIECWTSGRGAVIKVSIQPQTQTTPEEQTVKSYCTLTTVTFRHSDIKLTRRLRSEENLCSLSQNMSSLRSSGTPDTHRCEILFTQQSQ